MGKSKKGTKMLTKKENNAFQFFLTFNLEVRHNKDTLKGELSINL